MAAQAAPTGSAPASPAPAADVPTTAIRRKRFARWRPRTALAVVVLGLVGSQLLAFALALAAGGERWARLGRGRGSRRR